MSVPYFRIDAEYLKSLLQGNCELTAHHDVRVPTRSRAATFHNTTTAVEGRAKPRFLVECELHVRKLFRFVDLHVTKAENEFETLSIPRVVGIQIEPSEGNLKRNTARRLRSLKEKLLSLQASLQSSFTSLEELAKLYDEYFCSSDGRHLLEAKRQRRKHLEEKIALCLKKIDVLLQPVKAKESVRIETYSSTHSNQERLSYFTILCALLFLATWGSVVMLYSWVGSDTWVVFLRLVRSPLLIVFFIYLFGINAKIWARSQIEYIAIFGFPNGGAPSPNDAFGIAGAFTVLFATVIASFLIVSPFTSAIPGKVIPLFMWFALFMYIVNPLDVCFYRGRRSFLSTIARIILAPFREVQFADIWLTIQINGMIALLDLEYTLCYVVEGPWTGTMDYDVCIGSQNGVRPVVASIPTMLMLLQCLRRFSDKRQVKYLVNAGKFATTFPIIIFATLFSVRITSSFSLHHLISNFATLGWIAASWLLFALIHAIYEFIWDVHIDWGLFQFSKGTILRPVLLYQWKIVYCLAIVLDFVLQFLWTLEITLAIVWRHQGNFIGQKLDLAYTILVVGEVLRCFMWNFFKLEYQQVKCLNKQGVRYVYV